MAKGSYNLVCVAHPDDETIFFGGLVMRDRSRPWKIICVTDGDADGQGAKRRRQFQRACERLGVKDFEWWGFPDRFEKRLPTELLSLALQSLPEPYAVYTHGALGEYGHPHHQDVCRSVHDAFSKHKRLWSTAHNAFPEMRVQLTARDFKTKAEILTEIYGSETNRFLNLLPATFAEGYVRLKSSEVTAIHDFLAHEQPLRARALKAYAWMEAFIRRMPKKPKRLF